MKTMSKENQAWREKPGERNVQDVMDDLKRALDAKPQPTPAALAAEREAEARWCGRWRLVNWSRANMGVTFKVTAVRGDKVYCHGLLDKTGTAEIKVGDMEFLSSAGELQFLGK